MVQDLSVFLMLILTNSSVCARVSSSHGGKAVCLKVTADRGAGSSRTQRSTRVTTAPASAQGDSQEKIKANGSLLSYF